MVDDKFSRPNRDAYGQSAAPARSGNDPLAELARLIGNSDPFAGYGNDGAKRPVHSPTHVQSDDWAAARGAQADAATLPDPRLTQMSSGYDNNYADPRQGYPTQSYDQNGYQQPQGADPYSPQQDASYYGADSNRIHADEDMYDAPPPRSRALMLGGAAALLLMVGGVFAYRAVVGGSRSTLPPPVIKADTAPSKVTPPPQTQTDPISGKLIQDRVGGSQGERVVSREEQPIDMRDRSAPSRVIFPGPGASGNIAGANAAAAAPAPNSTEPKKIRTIAIKPDQAGGASDAVPPVTPSRSAAPVTPRSVAAPTPAAGDTTSNATTSPRQIPITRQQTAAATPSNGSGPLSLTPDVPSTAPARTASLPPAPRVATPAPATASTGGSGSYVQVTSQRSEADAQTSFSALQAKYPSVLGGKSAAIRRADLGDKGTYYRAMVGPLAADQANELCTSLKAAGGSCIVQRN